MIRQPPGGRYRGAFWGGRSDPALGLVLAGGPHLVEDWMRYGQANDYGELGWRLQTIGGSGGGVSTTTPSASDQVGLGAVRSGNQSGRGAALHLQLTTAIYQPPIGMVWCTKVDLSAKSGLEAWSGYASSYFSGVTTSDSTEFIGIRYDAAGAREWEGVCKTGATAASETTVALGDHSVGDYRTLGWEAVDTDGAGTLGIQFFTVDASSRDQMFRTLIGDPITTNIPITIGPVCMGIRTTTNAQRYLYQDFWCQGGRAAR